MATVNTLTPIPHSASALAPESSAIRVIVVDDTPSMLQALTFIMGRDPRLEIVGKAMNGAAAVSLATTQHPDLIVMDVTMPVMNGLAAAVRIKRLCPSTRIIMVSADDHVQTALAAMDCGADGFIPKRNFHRDYHRHIRRLFPAQTIGDGSPAAPVGNV